MEAVIYVVLFLIAALFALRLNWKGRAVLALIGVVASIGLYFGTIHFLSSSYELISGMIVKKVVEYDPEAYSCGAKNDQTCYRPRWRYDVVSNVNDKHSEYSYFKMEPSIYKNAALGAPYAWKKSFTNGQYMAENSVAFDKGVYAGWLPEYPDVYGGFQVDRCISNFFNCTRLNGLLADAQKTWGPTHKVNVIVVIVDAKYGGFASALKAHWIGGKKNDAVVVIYMKDNINIDKVEVFSRSTGTKYHTDGANFNMYLRDNVQAIGVLEEQALIAAIAPPLKLFDREDLRKYDFWIDSYSLAWYIIVLHLLVLIALYAGLYIKMSGHYEWRTGSFRRFH